MSYRTIREMSEICLVGCSTITVGNEFGTQIYVMNTNLLVQSQESAAHFISKLVRLYERFGTPNV